jgi:hypothetical protein
MKGQAALFEAALLTVVIILTFVVAQFLFKVQYVQSDYALKIDAERILIHWANTGVIYAVAYGVTGSGDPQYAEAALESLVPPNIGYNLTVISLTKGVVYSITRDFNPATAEGATFILMRGDGRIVSLQLSR